VVRYLSVFAPALIAIFGCYRLAVESAHYGYARVNSTYAIITSSLGPADRAVSLSPDDPEAHYTRALTLGNLNRLTESADELREAIRLRPHHYYEWLDLGVTRDRLSDQAGAFAAIKESVRLAPSFAQPHWQLGNLLYRQEHYDEAFAELRFAAASNPGLTEPLLDLAWAASNGEADVMENLVRPDSAAVHLQLALFLAKRGDAKNAVSQVKLAGPVSDELSRGRLQQTVLALLADRQFSYAFAAWEPGHEELTDRLGGQERVLNGDFKRPIPQNDPGFGWQLLPISNVQVSIDSSGPPVGGRSMRFDFGGEYAPATPLLSQIILVEPNMHYTLEFATRTEKLITGGPPLIVVSGLSEGGTKVLGQSGPLPSGDNSWNSGKLEFSTDREIRAVMILLQRLNCSQSACPIFGRLWLGGVTLSKT
jgi:tetratricopeptide (TPR) repeat protein